MTRPSSWRKAAALIGGLIIIGAADLLGVKDSTIAAMAGLIGSFIIGQGFSDWGKNRKGPA